MGRQPILECLRAGGLLLLLVACSSSRSGNNQAPGPSSVTATWTGSVSSGDTLPVGIQFALTDNNGQLTGQMFVQDPVTNDFLPDDDVTGTRNGSDASWQTSTALLVKGKFDLDGGFAGTLEFPAEYPLAIHVVDLALHR
jgi:hypothetical protein